MTKKKKDENNKLPLPLLILLVGVLLYAMFDSICILTLGVFGDRVNGTVDTYGSSIVSYKAPPNRSRRAVKGYYFFVDGKEYRGYVSYMTDDAWAALENGETRTEWISYLPVFPYINKPYALCSFNRLGAAGTFGVLLMPIGCTLLLKLLFNTARGKKRRKEREQTRFCAQCGAPTVANANYCEKCGAQL